MTEFSYRERFERVREEVAAFEKEYPDGICFLDSEFRLWKKADSHSLLWTNIPFMSEISGFEFVHIVREGHQLFVECFGIDPELVRISADGRKALSLLSLDRITLGAAKIGNTKAAPQIAIIDLTFPSGTIQIEQYEVPDGNPVPSLSELNRQCA